MNSETNDDNGKQLEQLQQEVNSAKSTLMKETKELKQWIQKELQTRAKLSQQLKNTSLQLVQLQREQNTDEEGDVEKNAEKMLGKVVHNYEEKLEKQLHEVTRSTDEWLLLEEEHSNNTVCSNTLSLSDISAIPSNTSFLLGGSQGKLIITKIQY